jgi:peptidoglycan/LPS O-acetylase OafA/YrhL
MVTAIVSIGIAALSFYLFEKRFLNLKDRFARTAVKPAPDNYIEAAAPEQLNHAAAL